MQSRKKILLVCLMVLGAAFCYSGKYDEINGIWDKIESWENISEKGREYIVADTKYSWGTGLDYVSGIGIFIDIDDEGKGMYVHYDTQLTVKSVEIVFDKAREKSYKLHVVHSDKTEDVVTIICDKFGFGKDTAFIVSPIYPLCRGTFYRLYGPLKIKPIHASVNADNVRLRTAPNLGSKIITKYSKPANVYIIEIGPVEEDDREESVRENIRWYKVRRYGFPDGWMFGKYLTFNESQIENSK